MALQPFQYQGGYQVPQGDFRVDPRTALTGLPGLTDQVNKYGETRRADEAVARAEEAKQAAVDKFAQMKKDMMDAMATDDPKIINATVQKHAEFQEAFKIAEQHLHKSKRTLNNSQELSYAYLEAKTPEARQALVDQRIAVMNEEGVPPEQRQQTEEFLQAHYEGADEGDPDKANRMLHNRLMIGDNKRYNEYLTNTGQAPPDKKDDVRTKDMKEYQFAVSNDNYAGTFEEWLSAGNGSGSTPQTDEDDFVNDMAAQYALDNPGKTATPGMRAKWRREQKRPQESEKFKTRLAERDAETKSAYLLQYNKDMGAAQAFMDTATKKVHSEGKRTEEEKRISGAQDMTTKLTALRGLYQELDKQGGIVNTKKSTMDNIWAAAEASAPGQLIGRMTGSQNQQSRNSIETIRPMLIQDIRKASEMGTRGLDSEKELAFYMKAATDTTIDIATNMAALAMLDSVYGSGELAAEIRAAVPPEKQAAFEKETEKMAAEGKQILDGRDMRTVDSQAQYDALEPGEYYYEKGNTQRMQKPLQGE